MFGNIMRTLPKLAEKLSIWTGIHPYFLLAGAIIGLVWLDFLVLRKTDFLKVQHIETLYEACHSTVVLIILFTLCYFLMTAGR